MKLINDNVLLVRRKIDNTNTFLLSDSELKETALADVLEVDENGCGWCSVGELVCVYKFSGILLENYKDGCIIVPQKDILYKLGSKGEIIMNSTRILVERKKNESEENGIFFEEREERTIGKVLSSSLEHPKEGDMVCFGANSGVDVLMPDGRTLMVFDKSEILFSFNG